MALIYLLQRPTSGTMWTLNLALIRTRVPIPIAKPNTIQPPSRAVKGQDVSISSRLTCKAAHVVLLDQVTTPTSVS